MAFLEDTSIWAVAIRQCCRVISDGFLIPTPPARCDPASRFARRPHVQNLSAAPSLPVAGLLGVFLALSAPGLSRICHATHSAA